MILDFDLDFLRDATALIDDSLERLHRESKASLDPDAFGIFDQTEYLIGFGFVACQTYATAVASQRKIKKGAALALGPTHRTGQTMAQLVNAAANHWKHSAGWSLDTPTTQATRTLEVISNPGIDPNASYPLATTLSEILAPHNPRFANLIPFLTQWRDAIPK